MNPKTQEALIILSEECAEVVQEVCKIQRFGIDTISHHTGLTHTETLEKEVADVLAMIDILIDQGVLNTDKLSAGKQAKFNKLKKWSKLYE
jgi:NTP pyrophosphatase (non-canonical NTP hydrolase)